MRIATASFLALSLAAGLFGQTRGAQPVVVGTVGSVVHPAGGAGTPGVTRTTPSVVHPGGGGVHLVVPGQNNRPAANTHGVYTYPVYVGGYYDTSYISQQDPVASSPVQPNVMIIYPPQPPPPTPIIIYPGGATANQDMASQQSQSAADTATPAIEPSHYLIAFEDHTIYAATAYWVDGDTLHYFTSGNTHNQVSLSLIDRPFTERLNKEAGVEVKLPAPAK